MSIKFAAFLFQTDLIGVKISAVVRLQTQEKRRNQLKHGFSGGSIFLARLKFNPNELASDRNFFVAINYYFTFLNND